MKKINLLLVCIMLLSGVLSVYSEVPGDDPFNVVGTDFLAAIPSTGTAYAPVLKVLFDDTVVYVDVEDDGIWELETTRGAGDSFKVEIPTQTVSYGTRIHASKPVIYQQRLRSSYTAAPPISSLKSSYYAYGGTWYIVSPKNVTVYVDNGDDGSVDSTLDAAPLTRNQVTVSGFARVYSNDPFYLYNTYTFPAAAGTDFYLPWSTVRRFIITEDNTEVKVDTTNDGFYNGGTITYNKGAVTSFTGLTFSHGAHIRSDKPITVYCYQGSNSDSYIYPVMPSTMIGSDMWLWDSGNYYYITGLFNNATGFAEYTTYHIDSVSTNDLNPESTDTVDSNQYNTLSDYDMIHLWGDMPFIGLYGYSSTHRLFPYSTIAATAYNTQKYLGANELTTIRVRVFNTYANTSISGLNLSAYFPDSFSVPDGGDLLLVVERRYLGDDAVIEDGNLSVSPSLDGSSYVFTVELGSLNSMEYYSIDYQLVTPSTYGSFEFKPVSVEYAADTWNMPQ